MSTFFRTFLPVIYVSPCENADQSKYRHQLEGVMLASDLFWTPDLILSVTVSLTYFIHEIRWILNTEPIQDFFPNFLFRSNLPLSLLKCRFINKVQSEREMLNKKAVRKRKTEYFKEKCKQRHKIEQFVCKFSFAVLVKHKAI